MVLKSSLADLKIELSENFIPDFLRYQPLKSNYQQAENGSQEVIPRRFFRPSIDHFHENSFVFSRKYYEIK